MISGRSTVTNAEGSCAERLGVEDDAFIVLNVGTVDIRKGADMFIETASPLPRGRNARQAGLFRLVRDAVTMRSAMSTTC